MLVPCDTVRDANWGQLMLEEATSDGCGDRRDAWRGQMKRRRAAF
jgi:hypothetical protein